MSFREKREERRRRDNEILKQMQEGVTDEAFREDPAGTEPAGEEKKAARSSADPALRKVAGYSPMTDEQIRKVKLILWPILFVIAVIVLLAARGAFG